MEGSGIGDLKILLKKYQNQMESLEGQIEETQKNISTVLGAIELLKRENGFGQAKLFEEPDLVSDKYKDMTWGGAIEDLLRQNQPHKLASEQIYLELVRNGFKSDSKDLKRDLYTRLNKMSKEGKILSTKKAKGKLKKYFLPENEEKTTEEEKKK